MNRDLLHRVLFAQTKAGKAVTITVEGVSMNPTLYEGDKITVQSVETYLPGDILVFTYKQEGLLVHRLLKTEQNRYFCKGDNSFRLEDLSPEQILGKVTEVNGAPAPDCPEQLIALSYSVAREFRRCGYDIPKTKQTPAYELYKKLFLRNEEIHMNYQKNTAMDYIKADETSLAVFDPATGDTHFFDETGISILDALEPPCNLDVLLDRLCAVYNAEPGDIKADVEEFLQETIVKKVVLAQ